MWDSVEVVKGIAGLDGVRAVALIGAGRDVLHSRFDADLPAVMGLAENARTIFRDVVPSLQLIDLQFSTLRLLCVPFEEQVLVVSVSLEASVIHTSERIKTVLQTPVRAARPSLAVERPVLQPILDDATGRAAVTVTTVRLIEQVIQTLGGPVVRNYLRKAASDLSASHPWIARVPVGLDGYPDLSTVDSVPTNELTLGCAAWIHALLARARAVVPVAAQIDLRRLAGEWAASLEAMGFFRHAEETHG